MSLDELSATFSRIFTFVPAILIPIWACSPTTLLAAQPPASEAASDSASSLSDGWGDASVQSEEYIFWALLLASSLLALFFAFKFFREMKQADPGNARMVEIAAYVTTGARAYLKQQYLVVSIFFVLVFGLLLVARWAGIQQYWVPFAFLTGGIWSAVAGYIGTVSYTHLTLPTILLV